MRGVAGPRNTAATRRLQTPDRAESDTRVRTIRLFMMIDRVAETRAVDRPSRYTIGKQTGSDDSDAHATFLFLLANLETKH